LKCGWTVMDGVQSLILNSDQYKRKFVLFNKMIIGSLLATQ